MNIELKSYESMIDDIISGKYFKKYFGNVLLDTSFHGLCKGRFNNRDKFLKVNKYYWKKFNKLEGYKLTDGTIIEGYHRIRINYKRSGILFWCIPEYGKKFKESFCCVNSIETEFWHPEIISKKEYDINSVLTDENFNTLGGRIKIVD